MAADEKRPLAAKILIRGASFNGVLERLSLHVSTS